MITPERYRQVLGHVPTAVAIVAAIVDGVPEGLSVGTFVPVSLEPALVGFFVGRTSTSWPKVRQADAFCVSVLGETQRELSARFARSGGDKFDGVTWHAAPSGHPVIDGSVAWVDCTLSALVETGDHHLVLGRVQELGTGPATSARPLLHHRGGYGATSDLASPDRGRAVQESSPDPR